MATTKKTKKTKGEPTSLNLWSAADHFRGELVASARVDAPSRPHFRRLLRAGCLEIEDGRLHFTRKGLVALAEDYLAAPGVYHRNALATAKAAVAALDEIEAAFEARTEGGAK